MLVGFGENHTFIVAHGGHIRQPPRSFVVANDMDGEQIHIYIFRVGYAVAHVSGVIENRLLTRHLLGLVP